MLRSLCLVLTHIASDRRMKLTVCALFCHSIVTTLASSSQQNYELLLPKPHDHLSYYRHVDGVMASRPNASEVNGLTPCSFISESGLADCNIEALNHAIVQKYFKPGDVVLETGARYGTTSCGIAEHQSNSGKLVSVDPDNVVWHALRHNRHVHNCNFILFMGVVGPCPVEVVRASYATRATPSAAERNGFSRTSLTFKEIQTITGLTFTALMIDCEGCVASLFLGDRLPLRELLQYVDTIIMEGDMPIGAPDCHANCVNYTSWVYKFHDAGFDLVESTQEVRYKWIWNYVFQRSLCTHPVRAAHFRNQDGETKMHPRPAKGIGGRRNPRCRESSPEPYPLAVLSA